MPAENVNTGHDAPADIRAYSFGCYSLDLDQAALLRDGIQVPLRPKSFDVLLLLVRNPRRLLSRKELIDAVWPDIVVTDDSLTQCLIEIRKALGEDNRGKIKTVPRRGYMFEADVRVRGPAPQSLGQAAGSGVETPKRLPSRWTMVGLLVLALAIGLTWWRMGPLNSAPVAQDAAWEPPPASIAVLPFVDMSEAQNQEYLADGIAEEILNLLAQSQGMTVIARTSSFAFKDATEDIGTIARRLNVAHVLEGSVRKSGDRLRVTAQLVDGASGAHVWSDTYEDRLEDLFAMQDKVARGVASVLEVQLTGGSVGSKAAHETDPKAWELYLQGRLFYSRRAEGDIMRAQRNFEQALEIDPALASAWVSLAATINLRRAQSNITEKERLPQETARVLIKHALERTLEYDPDQPEALWRMSYLSWYEGDPAKALEQFSRAVPLGQNHSLVQAMMGGFSLEARHPELSVPFMARAVVLDPLSASHQANLGHFNYAVGQFSEAESAFRKAMELSPELEESSREMLCWIKIHQQNLPAARELALSLSPGPARDQAEAMLDYLHGSFHAADEALARLLAYEADQVARRLAFVYAIRGDDDEAFRWLLIASNTLTANDPGGRAGGNLTMLEHSPFLRSLHDDERWNAWRQHAWLVEKDPRWREEIEEPVVEMLRSYLVDHPELYGSAGPQG